MDCQRSRPRSPLVGSSTPPPRPRSVSPIPLTPRPSNSFPTSGTTQSSHGDTARKRGRPERDYPRNLVDDESLSAVSSPFGAPVRTAVIATAEKDILIERLGKEIGVRLGFTLSERSGGTKRRRRQEGGEVGDEERRGPAESSGDGQDEGGKNCARSRWYKEVTKARIVVGTNQCTRALEGALIGSRPAPLLVLLARDLRPPAILCHVPLLCRSAGTPLILLPGRASVEMGAALGGRMVAVVAFLPRTEVLDRTELGQEKMGMENGVAERCHQDIDSFVAFACSKLSLDD